MQDAVTASRVTQVEADRFAGTSVTAEIQHLLDQYWNWLQEQTMVRAVGDHVEITTPYLDRHNDCLQMYASKTKEGFILTDDGYVLDDLAQAGVDVTSGKRRLLLDETLNGFGVREVAGPLQVETLGDDFGIRKHSLLQAMLAVADLFYLASPTVVSLFHEDVTAWLDGSNVRYTRNVKLTGRSGYDHKFDFVVPKSPDQPERVCRSLNRPGRSTVQNMAFAWLDTKEVRDTNSVAYAIINDADKAIPQAVDTALRNYGVQTIRWSDREEAVLLLAT